MSVEVYMDLVLFQPTLPKGSDDKQYSGNDVEAYFNPHSPKGVTISQLNINIKRLNFNPHSPKGVTNKRYVHNTFFRFQPTLPKGSDKPPDE